MMQIPEYRSTVLADGFAIVEDVISLQYAEELVEAVSTIADGDVVRRKRSVYGIRNLLDVSPAVRQLAADPRMRQFVTPILGAGAFAVRAIFFDKVADANWGLGWHQDSVIAVEERHDIDGFVAWSNKAGTWQVQPPADVLANMLAIRFHLDDCEESNGPLRVLPGSHRHGWLDDEIDHWKATIDAVTCTVGRGGIVAMRPLLLHASAPAESAHHRRVIHIEYASQPLPFPLEWKHRVLPCRTT